MAANQFAVGPDQHDDKPSDVNAETIEAVGYDGYPGVRDKAGQLLKEAGHAVIVTPADNKRILRKIDWAILPVLLTIYCLQSLDKTSLAYASVFGLIEHAHLEGEDYSWLGAIVYVAQLVWQPVVAYFLVKLPIGKFCATMVFCWGATLCGMSAARGFGGLMAARFLLGSFEASVAPTFIAIVQMWYRRSEQTNRNVSCTGSLNSFQTTTNSFKGSMVFNARDSQHCKCALSDCHISKTDMDLVWQSVDIWSGPYTL